MRFFRNSFEGPVERKTCLCLVMESFSRLKKKKNERKEDLFASHFYFF